ncbi:MAG: hypothetical protein MUF80_11425, partial [Burkholderiales bacterium]|nr:hypothetical protein [Burkholderiales bacterium]
MTVIADAVTPAFGATAAAGRDSVAPALAVAVAGPSSIGIAGLGCWPEVASASRMIGAGGGAGLCTRRGGATGFGAGAALGSTFGGEG